MQEKIVHQSRGGICYELNPIFYYFLKEIGFHVELVAATIFGNEKAGLLRTHIVILLKHQNKKYLIDVGSIDHTALQPVPFGDNSVAYSSKEYQIRQSKTEFGSYVLEKFDPVHLETGYYFDLQPIDEKHLNNVRDIICTSNHTPLNKSILLSKITDEGRATLTERSYTVTTVGQKTKRLVDERNFKQLCRDGFGIQM